MSDRIVEATAAPAPPPTAAGLELARRLWTGTFHGVLSTHSGAEPGYPFGSVAPYCLDAGGLPVFLFSHRAQHYHNLQADPRCAFTLLEAATGDVLQGARLTCLGDCAPLPPEDAAAAARYFRYYPRGRMYYEDLEFRLFRLVPMRFHYNGGFATARWLGTERGLRASPFDDREECRLIEHIEAAHPLVIQSRVHGARRSSEPVRVAGVDHWGIDLRWGDDLSRLHFDHPLASPREIVAHLRTLA